MKKFLFYINALNGGGAERVMSNLSSQFADKGYEVLFATSYPADGEYELNKKIKRFNLESENITCSKVKRNYVRIKRLRQICKRENPEVLVAFMAEPNVRAIIATIGLETKTIISVRNDPEKEYSGRLMNFVGKYILPMADGCVFQTEDAKMWFPKKLQNKSTIIFNAVKREFFEAKRNPVGGLVVTCGRLEEQKNHKLLIKAFSNVVRKIPNAKLQIYGDGSLKETLQQLIDSSGLHDFVKLMGQTSDVVKALEKADVFVLPSLYEGMPNALMEAMAVGVPCIATDCPCGGARMLLNDNNGILIKNNNIDELTNAIEQLIKDDYKKETLSNKCIETVSEFKAENIFLKWREYIEKVVLDEKNKK